jgi:hypothetical protein
METIKRLVSIMEDKHLPLKEEVQDRLLPLEMDTGEILKQQDGQTVNCPLPCNNNCKISRHQMVNTEEVLLKDKYHKEILEQMQDKPLVCQVEEITTQCRNLKLPLSMLEIDFETIESKPDI